MAISLFQLLIAMVVISNHGSMQFRPFGVMSLPFALPFNFGFNEPVPFVPGFGRLFHQPSMNKSPKRQEVGKAKQNERVTTRKLSVTTTTAPNPPRLFEANDAHPLIQSQLENTAPWHIRNTRGWGIRTASQRGFGQGAVTREVRNGLTQSAADPQARAVPADPFFWYPASIQVQPPVAFAGNNLGFQPGRHLPPSEPIAQGLADNGLQHGTAAFVMDDPCPAYFYSAPYRIAFYSHLYKRCGVHGQCPANSECNPVSRICCIRRNMNHNRMTGMTLYRVGVIDDICPRQQFFGMVEKASNTAEPILCGDRQPLCPFGSTCYPPTSVCCYTSRPHNSFVTNNTQT